MNRSESPTVSTPAVLIAAILSVTLPSAAGLKLEQLAAAACPVESTCLI